MISLIVPTVLHYTTQTLLERFKAVRNPAYKGIPLDKISTTIGMNGAWLACELSALFHVRSRSP